MRTRARTTNNTQEPFRNVLDLDVFCDTVVSDLKETVRFFANVSEEPPHANATGGAAEVPPVPGQGGLGGFTDPAPTAAPLAVSALAKPSVAAAASSALPYH